MALREDRKGRRHPLQGENMQIWLVGEGKDKAAEEVYVLIAGMYKSIRQTKESFRLIFNMGWIIVPLCGLPNGNRLLA